MKNMQVYIRNIQIIITTIIQISLDVPPLILYRRSRLSREGSIFEQRKMSFHVSSASFAFPFSGYFLDAEGRKVFLPGNEFAK